MDEIKKRIAELNQELLNLRRDFHRHPELGFEEHRTAGVVENYLKSIFDPDSQTDFISRENGHLLFRLLELKKLKKYDILNLAKATLKEFSEFEEKTFHYFEEVASENAGACPSCSTALYGNTKSRVFHRASCKSFNSITCTSLFNSHSEAVNAGFKPCRICKP